MIKDSLKLILVFLGTVFVVYGFPSLNVSGLITQLGFLLLIVYVFISKNDIFWLCWYFIVLDSPGRLFTETSLTGTYRLPLYNIAPGVSLGFEDIFLAMYIIKTVRSRLGGGFVFKREFRLYLGVGVFYLLLSFLMGISANNVIYAIRSILGWSWVLILPVYISQKKDLASFYRLLIPFVIIAFGLQIHSMITGSYLHNMLSSTAVSGIIGTGLEEGLVRASSATFISFIGLILSLHYLSKRDPEINRNLLIVVAILASLTTFLTATRGWIVAVTFLYASFFTISGFGWFKQVIRTLFIVGLVAIILTSLFPFITAQSGYVFERMMTLESLAEGDLTAGGTLGRLTTRGPRVMAVWRESPIIGWGFSNTFRAWGDVHVGNQTNLLNLGILGFLVINVLYLYMCVKTYRLGRREEVTRQGYNGSVFLFALLAMFAVHSSSTMLWGFLLTAQYTHFFWALLFTAISAELIPGNFLYRDKN